MPTSVQFRRGTTAQHSSFTGALGELTVDTSKKTIVVHDGTTAGGVPLAPAANATLTNPTIDGSLTANGSVGTEGQILASNGSAVYWTSPNPGDITGVTAGSGLTGGGASGDVTVTVLANTGIVANTTGVHVAGAQSIGNTTVTGSLTSNGSIVTNVVAVGASAIDCSTGTYFTKTATGALTWTTTNIPASGAYAFVLELTNGGTGTQTWMSGTKWPGGTAPTLVASGVDVLGFITDDGGTTWRGVQIMADSK